MYKIENAEMIEEDENEETVYIKEELDDMDNNKKLMKLEEQS